VKGFLHGRQAEPRARLNFRIGEAELVVDVGIAQRAEFEHAGNRKSRDDQRMTERHDGEVAPSRPAGKNDRPSHAMRSAIFLKPVERAPDFSRDVADADIGCQIIARHGDRPAVPRHSSGEAGKILPPVLPPIAAMDEHQAWRLGIGNRVDVARMSR
jgi:hypothetical protein